MYALVLVLALAACGGKTSEPPDDAFKQVALQLARHLADRDFAAAHAMLAMPMTREQLQQQYDTMVAPIGNVTGLLVTQTMTDWPDKQPTDAGWAYVAINGESGGEGITVVVTRDRKIRSIEFGRP